MQVELSFENWKRLTTLLLDEQDSYDAVIARLLANEPGMPVLPACLDLSGSSDSGALRQNSDLSGDGAYFKNVFLPEGTKLRATYKGKAYFATISDSRWMDSESGLQRTSPSQAAYEITKSGVNGWRFWMVKRPDDSDWMSLDSLRSSLA